MVVAGAASARSAALSLKSLLMRVGTQTQTQTPDPDAAPVPTADSRPRARPNATSRTGLHLHFVADALAARVLRTLLATWIPANSQSTHSTCSVLPVVHTALNCELTSTKLMAFCSGHIISETSSCVPILTLMNLKLTIRVVSQIIELGADAAAASYCSLIIAQIIIHK